MREKTVRARPAQRTRSDIPVRKPDPEQGLSREEAQERLEGGWGNVPVQSGTRSEGEIVRRNCLTFFNLIFVLLAAALFAVGSYKDTAFLLIAFANTAIGIFQEIRSKRAVDRLKLLAVKKGTVIREGAEIRLDAEEMVRDDIACFGPGSQIAADAVVRAGTVQVNEAMISGESEPLEKGPGDTLRSGSFVVSGSCRAQLTRVGADSYAARLTLEARKEGRASRSEMMASLDRLIRLIGAALLPVGAILFWKQYHVLSLGRQRAVTATVAALIGMIPEGLYLLTSVALAVSMIRLARKKTLARDMNCIETLARVDVLCVDKTGTITQEKMTVREVVPLDEERYPAQEVEKAAGALFALLGADNDTGRAMERRFSRDPGWSAAWSLPFQAASKYCAACFPGHGTYVAGAPEFVMGEYYRELREMVDPYSAKGYRVLLLAEYEGRLDDKTPIEGGRVRPMALALLANQIRPEAPAAFAYFTQQGVAVKVISGDNPLTASEVARKAGIEHAGDWVDAAALKSDADLARAAARYTVFGRVTPGQKRKLVRALQKQGHTVAMTGDGVNDVLALRDADCGIAMASGSDAASHAAQLVLLDSNFACLPQVVAEGRRVIHNIQRSAALFLVKNIFSFCLALLAIFVDMPYPLVPIQLSMASALTIGIPSFVLALEPNKARVRGRFMTNVLRAAFPGGLTNVVIILGLQAFAFAFDFPTQILSTQCAVCVTFVGLLILFQVCKPFNIRRGILWGAVAAAAVLCVLLLPGFFSLSPLNLQQGLVLAVFLALCRPVMRGILTLFDRGEAVYRRLRGLRQGRRGRARKGKIYQDKAYHSTDT